MKPFFHLSNCFISFETFSIFYVSIIAFLYNQLNLQV